MENIRLGKGTRNKILTIPNLLSAFRICLIPLFIWLYGAKEEYLWTAGILLLSGLTDIVDGVIARRFHMTSELGKILDPVADKLTQGAMLFCLIARFPLMQVPFVLLILKEAFAGLTGLLVIRKTGQVDGARWHGKVATCLLYAMMILHVVWYDIPALYSTISIVACIVMMLVSLVLYGIQKIRALRGERPEKEQDYAKR